jgi:hypothetical protein
MAAGSRCVKIVADGCYMLCAKPFKDAIGCVDPYSPKYVADLDALRRMFVQRAGAQGIQQSDDYRTFEKYLRKKYSSAVAFHCSNVLRRTITDIDGLPGSPRAEGVEKCLKNYPGIVHIWATAEDLQALFFPHGGIELPYLYKVEPDGSEMEQTATWSEQSYALCPISGTSRSLAGAIESHLPFRPVQSLPLREQAGYPSSSLQFPSIAQPQGPVIDIMVDYNSLTKLNCFRPLCGISYKGEIPEGSRIQPIFTLFCLIAKNKKLPPPSPNYFETKLWYKSKLAVHEPYAMKHGLGVDKIEWDHKSAQEATNFQSWLRETQGAVRVWVDVQDMHAVYVPFQAGRPGQRA